jgi:hypothetical protein
MVVLRKHRMVVLRKHRMVVLRKHRRIGFQPVINKLLISDATKSLQGVFRGPSSGDRFSLCDFTIVNRDNQ